MKEMQPVPTKMAKTNRTSGSRSRLARGRAFGGAGRAALVRGGVADAVIAFIAGVSSDLPFCTNGDLAAHQRSVAGMRTAVDAH
jgi:hypothetical protein